MFAQYRERFARTDLPGILPCFATSPALLKGMLQIAEGLLFGDSLLSRRHKEMIATLSRGRTRAHTVPIVTPFCSERRVDQPK